MRKRWLMIALVFLVILTGTALAEGTIYEDAETGVQFAVPSGWTEQAPEEMMSYMIQLEENGVYHQIIFGYVDLWDEVSEADKVGYTRSDIDNSILNKSDFTAEPGVQSVSTVTYNHIEYFKVSIRQTKTIGTLSGTVYLTMLVYIQDAVEYMFMYGSTSSAMSRYAGFEAMMRSVEYPAALEAAAASSSHAYTSSTTRSSGTDISGGVIFLSLIVTIAVYSLPIIIYRYGIRKRPVSPKKAKTITIVWAIIGFFIMTFIVIALGGSGGATGGGIFLWSYVNYRMLKSGWEDEIDRDQSRTYVTLNDAQGQTHYEGYVQDGCYEGKGTLFNTHGEVIYSGLFSGGRMDETAEARDNRINSFKTTCTATPMQVVVRNAQLHTGLHVRLSGHVSSTLGGEYAGECLFRMYYENVKQSDTVIRVRYHLGRGESVVPAGADVIVWGSLDEMVPSGMAGSDETLVPFVSAWYVEEASES